MSVKYKLIILFIFIIIAASLPLALFMLDRHEKVNLTRIIHENRTISEILTRSTLNILLMNGADINASTVDVKEMISILIPLFKEGLVYADTILLSSDKKLNGIILGSIGGENIRENAMFRSGRISESEIKRLENISGGYREQDGAMAGGGGGGVTDTYTDLLVLKTGSQPYFEFVNAGRISGNNPVCIARLVISKSAVLDPIKGLRKYVYFSTVAAIFIVSIIGYIFSMLISKPIEALTHGVQKIESGEYDFQLAINSRDEIGRLAGMFNGMAKMINLKIYELESTNRRLSELDRYKDQFLANTSHELKTPIHGIIGIADSLIDGAAGIMNETARHNLSMIVTSGRRLASLINDLLDFSRLKFSEIDLKTRPVNAFMTAQQVLSILKPLTLNKKIILKNVIDHDLPHVFGDEARVQQIFINLVGNAIKFTDRGEVVISASIDPDTSGMVRFAVTDTGIGIPDDKREIIFESFEQADGTISRSYGGTGLGLAITRKLVELHEGRVWAEPAQGKGTVFYFTLPVWGGAKIIAGNSPVYNRENVNGGMTLPLDGGIPEESPGAGRPTEKIIMIVDDEPVNLQVLINHLSLAGYGILLAGNAGEAMKIIDSKKIPDLLLLDVMMPGISGFDLCVQLRSRFSRYDLPIIMLTARNSSDDILKGFEAGANDYITKPFDRRELLIRVKNYLDLKTAADERKELSLINQELSLARDIQRHLIVREMPRLDTITVKALYKPAGAIGGDFYDFHEIDKERLGIFIADVTGHGVPAALIGAMLKAVFSMLREDALIPSLLIQRINSIFCGHPYGLFISANYTLIDSREKKIISTNAGHWPPVIISNNGTGLRKVFNKGKVLGFDPDAVYSEVEADFNTGDRIVFFTDGLMESRDRSGVIYGEENFYSALDRLKHLEAGEFIDALYREVVTWAGSEHMNDDIAVIVADMEG